MHAGNGLSLSIAVLIALAVAVAFLSAGRKSGCVRVTSKPLLTPNEIEFMRRLERALPGYRVLTQVSLAALITHEGKLSPKARQSVRNRFDKKIADFIICERDSFKVIALVELDDKTHMAKADRNRDSITKAAGYQTLRFESRKKPSEAEIAAMFPLADASNATGAGVRPVPRRPTA